MTRKRQSLWYRTMGALENGFGDEGWDAKILSHVIMIGLALMPLALVLLMAGAAGGVVWGAIKLITSLL